MIEILKGDVTEPIGDGKKIIVHCVNDIGVMGAGVAFNISKKWPNTREMYLDWANGAYNQFKGVSPFKLGEFFICKAEPSIVVCHLVGQKSVGGETISGVFIPPVRYEAIREGLLRLRERIENRLKKSDDEISIHSPLMGCHLAGGELRKVYEIVDEIFGSSEIKFYFYAFTDEDFTKLKYEHENVGLNTY